MKNEKQKKQKEATEVIEVIERMNNGGVSGRNISFEFQATEQIIDSKKIQQMIVDTETNDTETE